MICRLATGFLAIGLCISNANAIVIRHDRTKAAAIAFAQWLPQPVIVAKTPDGAVFGMGAKIGARFILTAAHVAEQISPGDLIGADANLPVRAVHYAPEGPSMERDIAVIELEDAFEDGDHVSICAKSAGIGAQIAIIGAGDVGDGNRGVTGPGGNMMAAENAIDELFPGAFLFRFDAPEEAAAAYLEGVSGPGDSGGPAFSLRDGQYCLVGVSSGQDSGDDGALEGKYGAREFYIDAVAHSDWIDAIPGLNHP